MPVPDVATNTLYCISSRLASAIDLGNLPIVGQISSGITREIACSVAADLGPQELYDLPSENALPNTRTSEPEQLYSPEIYRVGENNALIILPAIDPSDCHTFATEVLATLKPSKLIVVSPSNMNSTSEDIYALKNSSYTDTVNLPALKPPFHWSGAPASFMTRSEVAQIPSLALFVKAEGQQDFEIVDFSSVGNALVAALKDLGLVNLKLSSHARQSTLYI